MKMRSEAVTTSVLLFSAVAVVAMNVRREFVPDVRPPKPALAGPPVYEKDWRNVAAHGIRLGDTSAKVTIVEFADFECPFCRRFEQSYKATKTQYGQSVALVFIHFPLPNHRFARLAARVAECGANQSRFSELHDILYEKQDSLGIKPWVEYGAEAQVPDSAQFLRCLHDTGSVSRINDGVAEGKRIGVQATPTVIINGWRFSNVPPDSLPALVGRVVAGKKPDFNQ